MNTQLIYRRGIQFLLIGAFLLGTLGLTTIASAQANCGTTETVVKGDTLRIIAARCGVTLTALEEANPQIAHFNLIFPGQVINIPPTTPIPSTPVVTVSPFNGVAGTHVTVTGSGFPANTALKVAAGPSGKAPSVTVAAKTDANGKFSSSVTIPTSAQAGSTWVITAATKTSGGPSASAYFQVTAPTPSGAYTVVWGDTLFSIAVHFNTTVGALLHANPQITNPNWIDVGDQIFIPGTLVIINGQKIYFVKQGDFLSQIAANQNVTLAALEKANPQITHPSLIYPGQRIVIP